MSTDENCMSLDSRFRSRETCRIHEIAAKVNHDRITRYRRCGRRAQIRILDVRRGTAGQQHTYGQKENRDESVHGRSRPNDPATRPTRELRWQPERDGRVDGLSYSLGHRNRNVDAVWINPND